LLIFIYGWGWKIWNTFYEDKIKKAAIALGAAVLILALPRTGSSIEVLRLYLNGDVRSVGSGGFGPMFVEDWDLSFLRYPARISLDKTGRVIQRVEMEDTIRVLDGEMEGTYAKHMRISLHGTIPIESSIPVIDNSVLGILVARDTSQAHIINKNEGVDVSYDRTFDRGKVAYAVDIGKFVSAGLGAEFGSSPPRLSYIDGEILVKPYSALTLGYRRTPGDLFIELQGLYQGEYHGQVAYLPLRSSYFLNEVSIRHTFGKSIALYVADDIVNPQDFFIHTQASVWNRALTMEASYRQRKDRFNGTFLTPEGEALGSVDLGLRSKIAKAGVYLAPSRKHTFSFNFQKSWQTLEGGGGSIGDIIPELIFGTNVNLNLNFSNFLSIESNQIGGGYEWKSTGGWSIRTGFQHISIYPQEFASTVEASAPASSYSYLQEQDALRLNKIILGFFTAGIGHSWKHIRIDYAFAQVIPISVKYAAPPPSDSPTPPSSDDETPTSEGEKSKGWLDKIRDVFSKYGGGNTHFVELSYTF